MSAVLRRAIERRRQGQDAVVEVLKLLYPPGTELQWEIGGRRQRGVVVMNCYGDRINVLNTRTGRHRFICAFDIVC